MLECAVSAVQKWYPVIPVGKFTVDCVYFVMCGHLFDIFHRSQSTALARTCLQLILDILVTVPLLSLKHLYRLQEFNNYSRFLRPYSSYFSRLLRR